MLDTEFSLKARFYEMDWTALVFYIVISSYPPIAELLVIIFTFVPRDPFELGIKVLNLDFFKRYSKFFKIVRFVLYHFCFQANFMNYRTCFILCFGKARCFMNLLGNLSRRYAQRIIYDLIFEYKCLEICFIIAKPLVNKIISGWLVIAFLTLKTQFKFMVSGLTKNYASVYIPAGVALVVSVVSTLIIFQIGIYLIRTSKLILRKWEVQSLMWRKQPILETDERKEINKRVASCRLIMIEVGTFAISEQMKMDYFNNTLNNIVNVMLVTTDL